MSENYTISWQDLRENVSIKRVVEDFGETVNRNGAKIIRNKCKCPAHNDQNPSAYLYPKDNSWYCFACNTGGSCIDFVRYAKGVEAKEAAIILGETYGTGLVRKRDSEEQEEYLPTIDNKVLKAIGLKVNPYIFPVAVEKGQEKRRLSKDEATRYIVDSCCKALQREITRRDKIIELFPENAKQIREASASLIHEFTKIPLILDDVLKNGKIRPDQITITEEMLRKDSALVDIPTDILDKLGFQDNPFTLADMFDNQMDVIASMVEEHIDKYLDKLDAGIDQVNRLYQADSNLINSMTETARKEGQELRQFADFMNNKIVEWKKGVSNDSREMEG